MIDLVDQKPIDYNIDTIIQDLQNKQKIKEDYLKYLCKETIDILTNESTLLRISCPLIVCADISGKFYNLLEIFNTCGQVSENKYLFLGNYGFRNQHSLECLSLLFALKVKYPDQIFLLKGNRENIREYHINQFESEVLRKYKSKTLFESFRSVFNFLSLAAIIEDETFCVHSGIYPELQNVSQIGDIKKEENSNDFTLETYYLCQSNPTEANEQGWRIFGRGELEFGEDITRDFLQTNKLKNMIRGHTLQMEGYQQLHGDKIHSLYSAPNMNMDNLGSVISIDEAMNFKVITFKQVVKDIDEIEELYKKQDEEEEQGSDNQKVSSTYFSYFFNNNQQ